MDAALFFIRSDAGLVRRSRSGAFAFLHALGAEIIANCERNLSLMELTVIPGDIAQSGRALHCIVEFLIA